MDVGIVAAIVIFDRVNHGQWLLRGGRVVQINQRLPVHHLMQDGKVLAYLLHVVRGSSVNFFGKFGDGAHPTSSQFRSAPSADREPEYLPASGSPATTSFSR